MKTKVRLLSLLLAVLLLVTMLPIGSASAADGQTSYTKNKVVSVLFDNSGSMVGDRWDYARYALQTLMATLGKNDTLIITPMNQKNSWTEVTNWQDPAVIEVDLGAEDREAEITRVMTSASSFLSTSPEGGTPDAGIAVAVEQLVRRYGMKETSKIAADEKSENEYFLVVLTDGAFNCCTASTLEGNIKLAADKFDDDLSKYAFFQSIYIGFDRDSLDLSQADSLKDKANFVAYKAPDTSSIGEVMKNVANRITGRYPFENVTVSGTTVRIPLDSIGFGLRTVTVMATNTNARFVSATYNGTPIGASQKAGFDTTTTAMKGGFTAVLSRGANAPFTGGEIVLSLDDAPGSAAVVSVLLEPALVLEPVIEVADGNGRKEVDAAYINSSMKKNDTVYLSYRIVEQGTGTAVDPSLMGGASSARVTYNTKSYAPGEPITLVEGKKEMAISVTMLGGQYTLYTSFPCVVLENPTFFRIENGDVAIENTTTFKIPFTVYNQNTALSSLSALEAFSPSVSVVKEDGTAYTGFSMQKNTDGTFTVTLNTAGEEYGTYTVKASVKDADGNPRAIDVPIGYYPSGLTLTSTGADSLSKTLHGVINNAEGYSFTLTAGTDAEKVNIPFANALLTYRLTVGGIDVTKHASVNGNVLTYVPTAETLGDLASKTGEYDVVLTASFQGATTETVQSKHKLTLTDTVFEVVPLEPTGKVDRFALKKNQSTISFKVLRDGVPLSAEELQSALDDGTMYLDHSSYKSILSPVRTECTVASVGDTAVFTVRPIAGQFFLLRGLVTSMLVFGTGLDMDVHYGNVNAVGVISLQDASIVSYVWRILLILYIIQLVLLVLTFGKVKRIPQGVFVRVPIVDYDKEETELKGKVIVIKRLGLREYLILKRLIPFVGLCFWSKDIPTTEGTLKYHQNAGVCVVAGIKCMEGEIKPNGLIVSTTLKNKGWAALRPGTSFNFNKISMSGILVKITQKTSKANIDQPLTGTRGLVLKNKFYLFVSARSVGKTK
ncbi:MAG: VWA domain-containing protein [Ruminococcaceae bacterium]|nr:VWA domain-containing protein [Oscillospiraceae bacterium]